MNERDELAAVCARLGANPAQAAIMEAQLLKRAEQLAAERAIPRTEALAYLLNLVVQGRNGEVPPGFQPPAPGGKGG